MQLLFPCKILAGEQFEKIDNLNQMDFSRLLCEISNSGHQFKTKGLLTAALIAICGHKVSDSTALKF